MPADMMETNGVHTVIHFITADVKDPHFFLNVVLDWCLLNNNDKKKKKKQHQKTYISENVSFVVLWLSQNI